MGITTLALLHGHLETERDTLEDKDFGPILEAKSLILNLNQTTEMATNFVLEYSTTFKGLHKDLHTSSQSQHKMEGRFLLDVVVRKSSPILQLLSSKDQPQLVWGDALLVLNLGLDILNGVRRLHLQGNSLASQGLDKDLHSSSQSENQVKSRLLLDVVVRKSSSILQLLASKDQPLLVWGNSLLVLNLGLDILNGVRRLHLQSDGLACQGLDKDLHTSSQSQHKMEGRFLLDVVVRESSSILQLLASK